MLHDWQRTRENIIHYLRDGAKTEQWLLENCLAPEENEEDFYSLIQEMKDLRTINNHYGRLHLVTPESEARRRSKKETKTFAANPWAWYTWHPDSENFRKQLRQQFTKEDGRVFQALAKVILLERPPALGERLAGSITEEEGRYISRINEQLLAYLDRADPNE